MPKPLSIPEAAELLDLDPSRVRALVLAGVLEGEKSGGRWLVDPVAVERRRRQPGVPGRALEPHNAWALIFIAAGLPVDWLDAKSRWRFDQALALRGFAAQLPRLGKRARRHSYRAHPGELAYVLEDKDLVRSGISAAGDHGLVGSGEVEGYVRAPALDDIKREHALREVSSGEANVLLHVVPDAAWHLESSAAPQPAVAVDLAESGEPRSMRVGAELLSEIDSRLAAV